MSSASIEHERTVQIANQLGLHARPAAEFVKRANRYRADVCVRKDDIEVNGKSIMGMMRLAAEPGSELTIRASGEDSAAAVRDLVALVESRFGED
ncbi:MAG: HPr family phosphocarrier protein [Longimicrobiales bacterium]